ncbi:MAG: UDP-glucose/GDP-mannose dehydrogenase family protein [Acidobacteria bacterium]|nr:UDP-glucose/GDP-mannose dehydrogenase family protein [Acidobacteriota bacterium]MBV9624791.1 UDP-glucose/GDP-mannose dehydrogenase family protein [Acidobacteriota bacterium]
MQIAVVGSGYVGLVAGACLADLGHDVIVVDNDQEKLAALQGGEVPIHENFLPELLARHRGVRLRFSDDLDNAVRASSAIFIAVGTPPTEQGEADLSYVESVARGIAGAINSYKVVVEKSTVPVYTCDWVRRIILRNGGHAEHFDVASNPEFLREGTAVTDFLYPDRVVIGADSPRCAAVLREIYAPLTDGTYYLRPEAIPRPDRAQLPPPLIVTGAKSAELIKHASNAFLAMKISFINAVASICESVGADVQQVCRGIGTDSRIGPRFLNPGIGYGGSCFPKDLMAFRAVAREYGYDFRLLDEVIRINEDQRQRFIRKVRSALWTLRGKRLGVLGLAFKGGTDDIRESPAIVLIQSLLQEGCQICAYDPAAHLRAREALGGAVMLVENAYDAARGADALLILTEWEEFSSLDLKRLRAALRYPIVIDGRNLYDPELMAGHGFTYYSVGRPLVSPEPLAPAGVAPSERKSSLS